MIGIFVSQWHTHFLITTTLPASSVVEGPERRIGGQNLS